MNRVIEFNPKRFLLLIRNELFLRRTSILISSGAVGAVMIFISFMNIFLSSREIASSYNPVFYQKFYFWVLLIGGLTITGKMFKALHDDVKGVVWLTLPASIIEKFSSRLVISTLLLAAGIMALFFIVSLISEGLNQLFLGASHYLFNPFEKGVFLNTAGYFIIQSPFLLGAIYFKKHALGRTVLVIFGYLLLLQVITFVGVKIFFGDLFAGVLYGSDLVMNIPLYIAENDNLAQILSIAKWTVKIGFYYVFAPLCWIISYIRLKETEV